MQSASGSGRISSRAPGRAVLVTAAGDTSDSLGKKVQVRGVSGPPDGWRSVMKAVESRTRAEARGGELARRVTTLEHDVAAAREEAKRQSEAVRATAEESAQVRGDLEAAEARIFALAKRNLDIERHLGSVSDRRALESLAASPGVELLRLDPVPPFEQARGHVLMHPARDTVLLWVFDLPPARGGNGYRVRLRRERTGRGSRRRPWQGWRRLFLFDRRIRGNAV